MLLAVVIISYCCGEDWIDNNEVKQGQRLISIIMCYVAIIVMEMEVKVNCFLLVKLKWSL